MSVNLHWPGSQSRLLPSKERHYYIILCIDMLEHSWPIKVQDAGILCTVNHLCA